MGHAIGERGSTRGYLVLGRIVIEQSNRMWQDINDGFNLFNTALGRTWRIAND
jgi:hypothetical protein